LNHNQVHLSWIIKFKSRYLPYFTSTVVLIGIVRNRLLEIVFLHKHAVRLTTGTLVINIIYFVLLDRLMMAAVQRRTGPYNVGYFGLLQPMDDGLKLVKNEVIIPKKSSCILFLVVPNLFFYCSLILWSIIPLEGFCYNMDFTFNIFLQLFISNVQVVTNMSSGVTSNSKYTTYGSLRIGGQILS